jgi:hypothetical protein
MSDPPDATVTPGTKIETPPEPISLQSLFGKFLALAGLAYGVGFTVILTHTATLHAPLIEPFQAQTIIAGLPIWLLICVGVWSWPEFMHRIMGGRKSLSDSVKGGLITTAICLTFLIPGAIWIGAKTPARNWPLGVILFGLSGLAFALTITFVVQARNIKWNDPGVPPLFNLICFWCGFVFFVIGYALLIYPKIPQSLGGGHPARVRILLKDKEVGNLLAPDTGTPNSGSEPGSVLLYYRAGSYLLVSRGENEPLVQLPADQVRAVEWLDSQAR